GLCGSRTVFCPPADLCHDIGTCDPGSGQCVNPALADGSPCDDANACTLSDTCRAGMCVGAMVVCEPLDQCHRARACDPATGICSKPFQSNGTTCNGRNPCTQNGQCAAGACGGTAITCTPLDQCHIAGTCDPTTGQCSNATKPEGTACPDGVFCNGVETWRGG